MARKLGKRPVRHDPRQLYFASYSDALPPPPPASDWTQGKTGWTMALNDTLGDCTIAAATHLQTLWTMNAGTSYVPTDQQVLEAYKAVSGYDGTPNTDNGAVELDVLNFWRKSGIAGRAIAAFTKLNHLDQAHIKQACHLFGGIYTGVLLPDNFEDQMDAGQPWTLDPKFPPKPENGHAVPIVAYDEKGVTFITWGQLQKATWEWVAAAMDEAYGIVSTDFMTPQKQSASAFDFATLEQDLNKVV